MLLVQPPSPLEREGRSDDKCLTPTEASEVRCTEDLAVNSQLALILALL